MAPSSPPSETFTHSAGMDSARIETLADGIFAIVITLMVFDLKVPIVPAGAVPALVLPGLILAMWPKFASWLLSVLIVGVYWQAHHTQYNKIRRVDRALIWLNILYFMAIALIPFSASLLGTYPETRVAPIIYGLNLIFANLALAAHWRHATRTPGLVDADLDPAVVAVAFRRILFPPVAYSGAIALSFLDPRLSIAAYALVPWIYILRTPLDHFFSAPLRRRPPPPDIARAAD